MARATNLATWAKLGYVARGLIFILIGYVALSTGNAESGSDLFKIVEDMNGGTPMLAIIALGALGYGGFKIYDAIANLEGHDEDGKGQIKRAAIALGGASYLLFAFMATKILLRSDAQEGGGTSEQEAAQEVSAAGGDFLIVLLGVGLIATGLYQIKKAITRDFMRKLVGNTPPGVEYAGLAGYAARGITMAVTGWFVFKGGIGSSEEVKGLGETLDALRGTGLVYTLLSLGLMAFGLFSLVEARYRMIPNKDLRPGH